MEVRYRVLAVYIDGQATESYYATRQIAKTLLNSIAQQKNVTYAECFDLLKHEVVMKHSRAWSFRPNTNRKAGANNDA